MVKLSYWFSAGIKFGLLAALSLAPQLAADPGGRTETSSSPEASLLINDVFNSGAAPSERAPVPTIEGMPTTCRFTGSITATDPVQTGRLSRDGVADTCSASGTCMVAIPTGARNFDSYSFTNTTASARCGTVTLNTACTNTQFLYAAAYLGTFNPNNLCENWIADIGNSPNPTGSFSFNVPAGATVVIVVHVVEPASTCASYTLDVFDICLPTTCSYNGSIGAGDPVQTGRVFRDGVPDTCAAVGSCSVGIATGARRYDAHPFTNTAATAQCVTATLNTACANTNQVYAAAYLGSFNPANPCQNWIADSGNSPNPNAGFSFNVPAGATAVVVVHEVEPNAGCPSYGLSIDGCTTLNVQSAVSRKTHGPAGIFDVPLPLSGTVGIESRTGGATRDYTVIANLEGAGPINVTGTPQAQVTTGSGSVGSGGASNGGAVTVNGSVVTIPLTNVVNAQRLAVTLNHVSDGTTTRSLVIPMNVLVGDTNASGTVSATDISQVKSSSGLPVTNTSFRRDVNVGGTINATDISLVKAGSGTGLPPAANDVPPPTPLD